MVRSATTSAQFNDALDTMLAAAGPMAIATTYFPDTIAPERKRNKDWSWISSSVLRADVKIQLDTIKNNFRPHLNCWYAHNLDEFTTPLSANWGGYLKFPRDTVLLPTTTYISFPDIDHRLLEFFKYWNILRYFNPYNYVLDTSWDSTLINYSLPIANASTAQNLFYTYLKIAKQLDDAHVYGFTWSYYYFTPAGWYKPKIVLQYLAGKYIVVKSLETGIAPGDAVLSVDGLTTLQWEDSLKQFYSAGNSSVFHRTMAEQLLGRLSNGTSETVVIEDSAGINHSFNLTCVNPNSNPSFFFNFYYAADTLSNVLWTTLPCDVGYVNMANLQNSDAPAMYAALKSKHSIIFDLRNESLAIGGVSWLMYPNYQVFAKLLKPDTTYPGTYYWEYSGLGTPGNPNSYTGQVILLIGEGSQSHIEYAAMVMEQMPNVVKVGSQTAGADGDITWLRASNDMRFGWTSIGVFYPNGDSTQRIGIVPDTVAYQTAIGVRHHRDNVLEKALKVAGCNLSATNLHFSEPEIKIFPNPVNNTLTVSIVDIEDSNISISISDMVNRILVGKTISCDKSVNTTFDLAGVPNGFYIVNVTTTNKHYVFKIIKQ
jgi:hypothetical protein